MVRNLFQMLDLNRLSLQEICLDSVCSLHFPLNFSWILIPQKSYCFGSDPEQGHQTQKIFQLLISWVNFITTSLQPSPGIMVSKGNHSQMAELFRLVKYYNSPSYIASIIRWQQPLISSDIFQGP